MPAAATTTATPRMPRFRMVFVAVLAALTGLVAGVVAYGLYLLLALTLNFVFFQRYGLSIPDLDGHTLGYWIVPVPIIGGLLVSVMAKYGTPKIRGHGIPEAIEAVMVNRSRISPKVALFKPLSAALSIGTGGPFGAEGPIIQTGGALGSLFGQLVHMTAAERKTLLACGAAAGMAATFGTPIAAVIFAIELLLFEFRTRSFIPLVIASTLATTVHYVLMGWGPMFNVSEVEFAITSGLPFYLVLGLLCGLAAAGLSHSLYWIEDQFERLPLDIFWWPAIGGLALGLIGLIEPAVLGVGYDLLSDILHAKLALTALLAILVLKAVALLVSLGSGTSGGLLAPTFIIGAALGGAFALLANLLFGLHLDPAAYALVAMAAVFAAASRATFAFIIFAFEITRNYESVLPLMLVCVIANLLAVHLMRHSIMTEKLARRGLRVHQDYEVDVFHQVAVGEVMHATPPTLPHDMPLAELARRIAAHDPEISVHLAWPILDADGQLAGIITRGDVVGSLEQNPEEQLTVLAAGNRHVVTTHPDEMLHDAVTRMLSHDVGRLLVVERKNPKKLLGYLGRGAILKSRLKRLDEERVREKGWLRRDKNRSDK